MKRKATTAAASRVYRLRLELQYLKPVIWREIEVLSVMRLDALHRVIQVVMGWEECHLWAFEAGRRRFEPVNDDPFGFGNNAEDPRKVSLEAVLPDNRSRLTYTYDFGDDWLMAIVVAGVQPPEQGVRYPRCVAGERAGPLEDSGGPPGYEQLLAARKKPRSREAKELLEWAGEDWDPEHFDIESINEDLAGLPAPRRLH
jgi:hypothetical protein